MKRAIAYFGLSCVILAVAGCSQSSGPATDSAPTGVASPTSSAGAPAANAVPNFDKPDEAVAAFLKALRDGDDSIAEGLLTPKAREETAKRNLTVQPPGTPSATFQIGKVEFLNEDKSTAHVNCVWSERDDKNQAASYEIVWALRRLNAGWQIAGMATQVAPTDPPVFLNFEDPDDMLAKWHAAEERLASIAGQTGSTEKKKDGDTDTTKVR